MRVSEDSTMQQSVLSYYYNHRSIAAALTAKGSTYNVQFYFSPKTSNTPLRHHVEVRHALLYLEQAELHRWVIGVKFAKNAFAVGYTFKTLKHVISQPGVKLDALPPPPRPDPSDRLPLGILASQKPAVNDDLPPFTVVGVKDHIVRYLVANDVVRVQLRSRLLLSHSVDVFRPSIRSTPQSCAGLFCTAALGMWWTPTFPTARKCTSSSSMSSDQHLVPFRLNCWCVVFDSLFVSVIR